MLQTYTYHIANVFAESHFGGNPLAVFPNADGLTDEQMQAIAQQFNLSETVFLFAPTVKHGVQAIADLRIFTPNYEMPLAGHPTLGAAFIIQKLQNLSTSFVLNTLAKPVSVQVDDSHVELSLTGFEQCISVATHEELAKITGLRTADIGNQAYWMNAGTSQLILKVLSKQKLLDAKINQEQLQIVCEKDRERAMLCLWSQDNDDVFVRFFSIENDQVVQDSGTGSACANLGAYFISQNQYPTYKRIFQGDDMGRPNRLTLKVDESQTIFVGGNVISVGKGEFYLP